MSEIENLEREVRAVLVLLLWAVDGEGGRKCWQFLVLAIHYTYLQRQQRGYTRDGLAMAL